jgi:prolyl-tRNA editing enzyme YbaK/EbsC (Cys-tRNA(Pro) deacylase)
MVAGEVAVEIEIQPEDLQRITNASVLAFAI